MRRLIIMAALVSVSACTTDSEVAGIPQPVDTLQTELLQLCLDLRDLHAGGNCDELSLEAYWVYCRLEFPDQEAAPPNAFTDCWPYPERPQPSDDCVEEALPFLNCLASQTVCTSVPCVDEQPRATCLQEWDPEFDPDTPGEDWPVLLPCSLGLSGMMENGTYRTEFVDCDDGHTRAATCKPNTDCELVCSCEMDGAVTRKGSTVPESFWATPDSSAARACGFVR
jgi:hypothetical protein